MADQVCGPGAESATRKIMADFHVHTCYSDDALTTLAEVIAAAAKHTLGAVCILDHNVIEGALALRAMAPPFLVVVGEEIMTEQGEIAGLFLEERIPPGLSLVETVDRIRQQGGLVYVPHPVDRYRGSAIGEQALRQIVDVVDIIEVLNARNLYPSDNARAMELAREANIFGAAGSDAHSVHEIGQAYVVLEPFHDGKSLLESLRGAQIGGSASSPHVHLFSTWAKLKRRVQG